MKLYACPIAQCLHTAWQALSFFGPIAVMECALKTRTNSSTFSLYRSSQRSSPQAISHGFPSVHPVVASVSLLPNRTISRWFPLRPVVSRPVGSVDVVDGWETMGNSLGIVAFISLLPNGAFLKLSHGFPSVHLVVASISLPPNGALPKLFPAVSPSNHPVVADVSLPPRQS